MYKLCQKFTKPSNDVITDIYNTYILTMLTDTIGKDESANSSQKHPWPID